MPNRLKITGEVGELVVKLHNEGCNPTQISQRLPFPTSKDTIKSFLSKNGLVPNVRKSALRADIYRSFVDEVQKDPANWSVKRKKYRISFEVAKELMENNHIVPRDRAEASKDKHLTEIEIQQRLGDKTKLLSITEEGYQLMCEDGHIYTKKSAKIDQGCPNGKSGTRTNTIDMARELLEIGYKLIENTFVKKRKALKAIHLKCGDVRENRYRNFFVQECATCGNNGVSKEELSLRAWIEDLGFQTEKYKFKERITKPKEIDVHIPSLKIGFEYCGLYDHTEDSRHPRGPESHNWKRLEAAKEGIRLITIYSSEWRNRNYQVKSFIKSVVDKNARKIYAKQCTVRELDKDYGAEFLRTYHIQGECNSIFHQGIFLEKELIGVMTFSRHHTDPNSLSITLSRLCFKTDTTVVGGASKMLESAKDRIKQLGYSSIKTWSDNRWSEGNVYLKMGFSLHKESSPSFDYVRKNELFSKQSLRFTDEERKLGVTEEKLRKEQGYSRIWDCGKKTWILNLI
jgi:hypothetical protein